MKIKNVYPICKTPWWSLLFSDEMHKEIKTSFHYFSSGSDTLQLIMKKTSFVKKKKRSVILKTSVILLLSRVVTHI